MAAKNTVEILKNISKAISSGSGFGSVLKNVSFETYSKDINFMNVFNNMIL